MKQVKIITTTTSDSLENKINMWLKENPNVNVISLQYSTAINPNAGIGYFSIAILYEGYGKSKL